MSQSLWSFLLSLMFFLAVIPVRSMMGMRCNVLKVGATRKGKTLSAVADMMADPDEACITFDAHQESLTHAALTHAEGNVLYENLSDVKRGLGFSFLTPSTSSDPLQRDLENQRAAEAFVEILLRKRGTDGLGSTPLMEEWVMAALLLWLCQRVKKPLTWLPSAFMPGTQRFAALVQDCRDPDVRNKFRQLEGLSPRSLRSEVGSASRLFRSVFGSPAFALRAGGGFHLGAFLQNKGKLLCERGGDIGDDTMRTIMGAISLLAIDHAKRRPKPWPPIRLRFDEATNAKLAGAPELRGIAETSKNGLYFDFYVQNLDFPGGSDGVLQNCLRHEWFGCPYYDLARKAAVDILAGLPRTDASRAQRLDELTSEIMNLPPGWRWVRDPHGSRKEYVPILEHPWPDWPGLREKKLAEKLAWIHARPEYLRTPDPQESGENETPLDLPSPHDTPSPPTSSPAVSSPAERWKRKKRKPADGS